MREKDLSQWLVLTKMANLELTNNQHESCLKAIDGLPVKVYGMTETSVRMLLHTIYFYSHQWCIVWEILTCFSTKMNHIGEQAFPCHENYISVYSCSSKFSNTSMNHGCSTNMRHNRQPDAHLISIWSLQYKIFSKTTITEAYQSQQNCSATTDCTRDKNSAKKNATHMMLMYHLCGCHINHGSLKYRASYWISRHHQHIMKLVWPLFCTWITDCDPYLLILLTASSFWFWEMCHLPQLRWRDIDVSSATSYICISQGL